MWPRKVQQKRILNFVAKNKIVGLELDQVLNGVELVIKGT